MSGQGVSGQQSRALVTGGAHGIGLACARRLAAEGFDLAIADDNIAELKQVTLELRRRHRVEVSSHACDLSRVDHQEALVAVVGPIDAVVHTSGTFASGDLKSTTPENWNQGWNGRIFSTINLSRLIIPSLEQRSGGVIVSVLGNPLAQSAPTTGDDPSGLAPVDARIIGAVGNAALAEFTRSVGSTSIRTGVRVVAVDPGPTVTTEVADFLADEAERRLGDRRRWTELVSSDPIPNRPEDVAEVVSFLISEAASSVSGTVVELSSGHR